MSANGQCAQAVQTARAAQVEQGEQTPMLKITGLTKSFTIHAVDRRIQGCSNIDLSIMPGEFVGITGRSGSGKSTILRCIYRTNLPESGSILYDSAAFGRIDLAQATQRQMIYLRTHEIGYVSQFLSVLPRRNAYDIVMQSAIETYGCNAQAKCRRETSAMLRHFDLAEDLWDVYPRTFSGGEKLRLLSLIHI